MPRTRKRTAKLVAIHGAEIEDTASACDCCWHRLARNPKADCLGDDMTFGPVEHAEIVMHGLQGQFLANVEGGEYEQAAITAMHLSRAWVFLSGSYAQREITRRCLAGT